RPHGARGRFLPGTKCAISGCGGKAGQGMDCFGASRKLPWAADGCEVVQVVGMRAHWASQRGTGGVHNRGLVRRGGRRPQAAAALAAVIRMLAPRRGVVPTSVAPLLAGRCFFATSRKP